MAPVALTVQVHVHMLLGVSAQYRMGERVSNGTPAAAISSVNWVKSRRSGAQGNCVEVAVLPMGLIAVRDSQTPTGPALIFGFSQFTAFINNLHTIQSR